MARLWLPLVVGAAMLTASGAAGAAGLFDDGAAIAEGVAAIKEKIGGGHVRALRVEIGAETIAIQVQEAQDRRHIDEWRWGPSMWSYFGGRSVSGPHAVALNLINPDLEANLFDLDAIDFAAAGKLAKAALAHAALEDPARVSGMEIQRQILILPPPSSGPVLWTTRIRSERESAQIIADAKGRIVGQDLSGTNRMKNFDMLRQLEFATDAARDFKQALGAGPILIKVRITRSGVGYETNLPENPADAGSRSSIHDDKQFSWNLSGMRKALAGAPHFNMPGMNLEGAPFGVDEVDWALLPKLAGKAREALAMPHGTVSDITLSKPTTGIGAPILLWEIEVTDRDGARGTILADTAGVVKRVRLPASRRKPSNWLDPATIVDALAQIDREFGAGAKFTEFRFYDDKVMITAPDPRQPGQQMTANLSDKGFDRLGGAFAALAAMNAGSGSFTIADLAPLTTGKLADLEAQTLARMKLPNIQITNVAIGRGNMDPSPRGNVAVEIRALVPPFNAPMPPGGRIVHELDGSVIQAYLPSPASPPATPGSEAMAKAMRADARHDYPEALRWYREAADQGNLVEAQFSIGMFYKEGLGVARDYGESLRWLRKAAEQGYAKAQFSMGLAYDNGLGVQPDAAEAARWFKKAAEQGDASAQWNIGFAYLNGHGVPKDDGEALRWCKQAAAQGHVKAQFAAGVLYLNGRGTAQNDAEALHWFQKAAAQGLADAQYQLAVLYLNGLGVAPDDAEALRWLRKAAEQGHAEAQYNAGVFYTNGTGAKQDWGEALRWYQKAADQGYAPAQRNLGVMYENGQGLRRDYAAAMRWLLKAADQGDALAQANIGNIYAHGLGVPQSEAQARQWMEKAAAAGEEHAKQWLSENNRPDKTRR